MAAHSARKHARLAPSAAHRWSACPGSIRMSVGIEGKRSVWADEGTAAHTLAEWCLSKGYDPIEWLGGHVDIKTGAVCGARPNGPPEQDGCFEVTEEMVESVNLYIETVRSFLGPEDEVEYEAKLDLRHIPGMDFGTGDCVIYKPEARHLVIVDLKYGRGVPVDVKSNEQLRAYALGAAKRFHNRGVRDITTVIVQPRCPHPDGPVRLETIDAVELLEFRLDLVEKAEATMAEDAPLVPGDHCGFCPAKGVCPALRERVKAAAEYEFGEVPPVGRMTPDEMADVLREADLIKTWLKGVEERANEMAHAGTPPTGFKLVATRATRKWRDEKEASAYLRTIVGIDADDAYTEPKLKSPAQVEKVIGSKRKGEIAELVIAKSSGTILVPVEDPRPPVRADAESEFEPTV